MPTQDLPYTSGANERESASNSSTVVMAMCGLAIILALVLGVGLASNLVIRHLVQTAPVWAPVVLGFRRARATAWVALPLFVFWLLLMSVIWSYLLGISHLLSGHFSTIEIAMTITVGTASAIGIGSFVRFKSFLSPWAAAGLFVVMGIVQFLCFRYSFLPAIAHH